MFETDQIADVAAYVRIYSRVTITDQLIPSNISTMILICGHIEENNQFVIALDLIKCLKTDQITEIDPYVRTYFLVTISKHLITI